MHSSDIIKLVKGKAPLTGNLQMGALGRQVAQLVEHQTLEVEVWGWKSALGTWWWGQILPIQEGWVEPVRGTSADSLRWSRDDLVLATPALVLSGTITTNFGAGSLFRS